MLFLCGAVGLAACRGAVNAPEQRPEVPSRDDGAQPDESPWRWGGWHEVPFDPEVGDALQRARELERAGDAEGAIGALNLGLERAPRSWVLFEARGALYRAQGFLRAAQRDFETVVRLRPERGPAWGGLGLVRQELELPRGALSALDEARRLGVDAPELRLASARALRRLGHREEAALHYAQALRQTSDHSPLLLLEAASLALHPDDLSPEIWLRARELTRGQEADGAPKGALEGMRVILSFHGEVPAERLLHAFQESGLRLAELEAWTRTALVAVTLERSAGLGASLALGTPAQPAD